MAFGDRSSSCTSTTIRMHAYSQYKQQDGATAGRMGAAVRARAARN